MVEEATEEVSSPPPTHGPALRAQGDPRRRKPAPHGREALPTGSAAAAQLQQNLAPLAKTAQRLSKDPEIQKILQALHAAGNNRSEAARRLGISREALYKKMRKYDLLEKY